MAVSSPPSGITNGAMQCPAFIRLSVSHTTATGQAPLADETHQYTEMHYGKAAFLLRDAVFGAWLGSRSTLFLYCNQNCQLPVVVHTLSSTFYALMPIFKKSLPTPLKSIKIRSSRIIMKSVRSASLKVLVTPFFVVVSKLATSTCVCSRFIIPYTLLTSHSFTLL